jgi:hypothetical protein
MDCPNCGAYNASNSFRCRRCNHVLPAGDDDSSSSSEEWGPASDPDERWEEHFRSDPSHSPAEPEPEPEAEPEWSDPWTTPDPEPSQPSDWKISQPSSSGSWSSRSSSGDPLPGGGGASGTTADIPNYLWPSVGATLCCCPPLGIPAIVFASRVDAFKASGDRAAAEEASGKAKNWLMAAVGVWLLFAVLFGCISVLGGGEV